MIDTAIQRNQRGWHGVSSTDEQRSRPAASVQPRTPHIEAPDGSLSLSLVAVDGSMVCAGV